MEIAQLPATVNSAASTALALIMAPPPSKNNKRSIKALSDRIAREHLEVLTCMGRALEHAVEAGSLLSEVKRVVGHGGFEPWLIHFARERNISIRSCRIYMQLSRAIDDGEIEIGSTAADLTIRAALARIRKRKPSEATAAMAPDRPCESTGADRDRQALSELGQLQAKFAELLDLLAAVQPITAQRFLRETREMHPWREARSERTAPVSRPSAAKPDSSDPLAIPAFLDRRSRK